MSKENDDEVFHTGFNQPTMSKHWKELKTLTPTSKNQLFDLSSFLIHQLTCNWKDGTTFMCESTAPKSSLQSASIRRTCHKHHDFQKKGKRSKSELHNFTIQDSHKRERHDLPTQTQSLILTSCIGHTRPTRPRITITLIVTAASSILSSLTNTFCWSMHYHLLNTGTCNVTVNSIHTSNNVEATLLQSRMLLWKSRTLLQQCCQKRQQCRSNWQQSCQLLRHCCWCGPGFRDAHLLVYWSFAAEPRLAGCSRFTSSNCSEQELLE